MKDYSTKARFIPIEHENRHSSPEKQPDLEIRKPDAGCSEPDRICYRSGDLLIDPVSLAVYRNGQILSLGKVEYAMIFELVSNAPFCCSRGALLETAGSSHSHLLKNNTLSKHINRIRGKLGAYRGSGYIATCHSIGYQWKLPVEKCPRIMNWKDIVVLQDQRRAECTEADAENSSESDKLKM